MANNRKQNRDHRNVETEAIDKERSYREEAAAEVGAFERKKDDEDFKSDVNDDSGRNLGWLALALSIISLFVLPVFLGAVGIIVGFIARRRGSESLGSWAIGIGIVSVLLGLFVLPFF